MEQVLTAADTEAEELRRRIEVCSPRETMVGWLMRMGPGRQRVMTRYEQDTLKKGLSWAEDNPERHTELGERVGTFVRLKAQRGTMGGGTIPAGTRYYVLEQWCGNLHGVPDGSRDTIVLKPDWVE